VSPPGRLRKALRHLLRIRELDPSLDSLLEKLNTLRDELAETASELESKRLFLSPDEIDLVNAKLYRVQLLERKYRKGYAEIVSEVEQLKKELIKADRLREKIERRREELERIKDKLLSLSKALSLKREKAARRLSRKVEEILEDLNLKEARLVVEIERGDPGRYGWDRVKFLFSSYGRDLKPLGEIASGGELTRLFLALALIMPPVQTFIFDEVDVGVSGETSVKLARLLKKLSRSMQIIAVTHSAPLCAAGDLNLVTERETLSGIPYIRVRRVEGEEKLREVARLMGAATENTVKGAGELMELVEQ